LKNNLQKIAHHGKRADAIVKGMLQHSKASTGQREVVNMNELCEEYLRLAFHGLRAKDKSFQADYKTDFDANVAELPIVRQDFGRVLLNIINNAFFAVNEKKKQADANYQPLVTVRTVRTGDLVEIFIADNGNGIPKGIQDKIFQPFFTTKPTGQGTGLGLSISYDIVKSHGGELFVTSEEGEGTTFRILLRDMT